MADTTPAQQQYSEYPSLNPYASSNGSGASTTAEESKSFLNSKYPSQPPTSPEGTSSHQALSDSHPDPMSLADAQQTAQKTMEDIKNSPTVQSVTNGPVAEKARAEATATQNEFANLAASRQTPQTHAATGQDLTHYHSFFYNLLSWENPRATAISYASIVLTILVARYVPVTRYALKALYIVLGITAAAEIAGKVILGQGVATKMRPKKLYTIPPETVESVLSDLAELVNFFVIEFQRVIFAENVYVTVAAFVSAFITYFLVKIMPAWGLFLFFTTVTFFAPLVYITNKEFIDEHLGNAQKIVSEQASQVRGLAAKHTGKAWEASQSAFKEYSSKAQEAIGHGATKAQEAAVQAKQAAVDKGIVSKQTADKVTPEKGVSSGDFPAAPKEEPAVPEATTHDDILKKDPIAA